MGIASYGWVILILWLSKKEGEGKNQYGLAE